MISQEIFINLRSKDQLNNWIDAFFCPQTIWIIILILGLLVTLPVFGENNTSTTTSGFIENKGQFRDKYGKPNPEVLFVTDLGGMKVQLRKSGFSYETYQIKPRWVDPASGYQTIIENGTNTEVLTVFESSIDEKNNLQYHFHRIDIELKNMNPDPSILLGEKHDESHRYILPADENAFLDINNYANITFQNIYPDIDLVFKIDDNRQFKYDFIVHPNGKIEDIQLEYKGADNRLFTDF
jgi:hypothetical protein